MRRHLPPLVAALAALAVVPTAVMLPTLTLPGAEPHPVPGKVTALALAGVDAAALRDQVPPDTVLRSASGLGVVAAAMSRRPVVLTAQRTTSRFDLLALTWTGDLPVGTSFSARVHEDGVWSSWQPLDPAADGPDDGSGEARAAASRAGLLGTTEPLLTDGADGVQVRVDSPGPAPLGLKAQLVDGGRSSADSGGTPPATAAADTPQPTLVTRSQWGADESLVKGSPSYSSTVKALVLHHTDTTNSYSADQAYAQVRSVYVFHTKVRGWNDIGYNFVVDRFGRVYEGRKGSITDAVVGAHAGGFNDETLGIAALGSFSTTATTSPMLAGIESVMAWKAAQYGINPRGKTVLTSAGSSYTSYPEGTDVTLPTIIGHRDVGQTECPGNQLYPKLGEIRSVVAAKMAPGLLSPAVSPATAAWGGSAGIGFTAGVPTTQRWWLMATSMCGNQPVRTISGRTADRISATWDLKDDAGNPVPPGVYQLTMITSSPVGAAPTWTSDVEVLPAAGAPASPCSVTRLVGTDPVASAVLAGQVGYPGSKGVVLVAQGIGLDSLVAAPLAHAKQAPLLFTPRDALPDVVVADLKARGVTSAWIVGGPNLVGTAVEQQLKDLGVTSVVRLSGSDRYAMAGAVAKEVGPAGGGVVVVNGENGRLLDLAAAAGPAAALNRPVLLVSAKGVPAATGAALTALKARTATVVGSRTVVPQPVMDRLAAFGVTNRSRATAGDRYTSAATVASAFAKLVPTDRVVIVPSGDDALVWSALGAAQGRVELLVDAGSVPAATSAWLAANKGGTSSLWVAADPAHASPTVLRGLLAALR